MTDKEKIRKEVERLQKELVKEKEKGLGSDVDDACILELQNVLTYIDSLQDEPVSNDLEEAATKYARKQLSNPDYPTYNDEYEMECAFEAGAQWQKEQLIEKACEWLKENKDHPFIKCEDPCLSGYLTDEFIEDFKEAMEE